MKYAILALLLIASPALAQTPDPSTLPLVQQTGVQYVGSFKVPHDASNGETFEFGGLSLAFNPAHNSLFVSNRAGHVAEVSIPALSAGADTSKWNAASYLQGFADPTEGHLGQIGNEGLSLGGLLVQNNTLYGTGWIYYDANNAQRVSHYSHSLQLNQASFVGWSSVWDAAKTGYVSGYLAAIPVEHLARLGGPTLTGQCCIPIVSRTSFGPDAFAFDASKIAAAVTVPASPLLYYTGEHPTLGAWAESNLVYGMTTGMGGVVLPSGTRSALFVGRNGMGTACYGEGTPDPALVGKPTSDGSHYCLDPVNNYKGTHAYPYRHQIWAYDLNDFAAVKAGTKQPWEVTPYGVWALEFPVVQEDFNIGGVGYDAQRRLMYVSQPSADPEGYRPLIHVYLVTGGTPPPVIVPPVVPPVPPLTTVNCTVQSVSTYADKDAKLTVRCDTNGTVIIPKATTFTVMVKTQ